MSPISGYLTPVRRVKTDQVIIVASVTLENEQRTLDSSRDSVQPGPVTACKVSDRQRNSTAP